MENFVINFGADQSDSNSDAVPVDDVMTSDSDVVDTSVAVDPMTGDDEGLDSASVVQLSDFIDEFGDCLLSQIRSQNPPVFSGESERESAVYKQRASVMDQLKRKPFQAQADVVQAVAKLLVDCGEPAAVINAEMGTGKTMMAICTAAVLQQTHPRTLVISPPHLVYKWRREIMETVPGARVWVLNGPDTLRRLLAIRDSLGPGWKRTSAPEFFVLGRVRMRMGFHWKPAFNVRHVIESTGLDSGLQRMSYAACPRCGSLIEAKDPDGHELAVSPERAMVMLSDNRSSCTSCNEQLWSLVRPGKPERTMNELVIDALKQMPTIGEKSAARLLSTFGAELLSSMLGDNVYEFLNLMDEGGNLVFTDRQAARMERSLATFEFSVGNGGYQPTEFIKRQLPRGYFGLLVVDEGHEYKNEGSAQGQAMGVLASMCHKVVLLTGTLMGGYADDLFFLLWRLNPSQMIADGFRPVRGSLGSASMAFMREHGVLKDVFKDGGKTSHRTAKAKNVVHRTSKAPGFGPKGILRYVLPITVFLKLRDIGQSVLPSYDEVFTEVQMSETQAAAYERLERSLVAELKQALAKGDATLLGVVMNVLLAWPDCCFRPEAVRHPRTGGSLHFEPRVFDDGEASPKELAMIELCTTQKLKNRKVLLYTVYTGTRDTTARLKYLLEVRGFKVGVLRATVAAAKREDWVAEQVDKGIDVLITNPELVKTGLDLLDFPTIVYMQSGYNVYTVQQASRRSWRIGQRYPVEVHFLGYSGSAQMDCLKLMAKKISVSQSTSGDMPDSGLDVLNDAGESLEMALAKKLVQGRSE